MLQAVIFDFDGVLVDSEPLHCRAFLDVVGDYGITMTEEQYYARYLGYTDAECIEALSRDFAVDLSGDRGRALLADKKARFEALAQEGRWLIEGAEALVRDLAARPVHLAICSGALRSDIELLLRPTCLLPCFTVMVTAEDVHRGKPDPEPFLLCLERLRSQDPMLDPAACVVVEDSHWGLEAARAAGLPCVAVAHTYPTEKLETRADQVVESVAELSWEILESATV